MESLSLQRKVPSLPGLSGVTRPDRSVLSRLMHSDAYGAKMLNALLRARRYLLDSSHHPGVSTVSGIAQNDLVVLAGRRGTWKVVAPVNGSKADIRRKEGFDTRIVTAPVTRSTRPEAQVIVIDRAGVDLCPRPREQS